MLRDIANSDNPIQGLVELALKAKGADINSQTVRRYTDMLQTALEIDNGTTHKGGISDFIYGLPEDDKFGTVVRELGSTLNASNRYLRLRNTLASLFNYLSRSKLYKKNRKFCIFKKQICSGS